MKKYRVKIDMPGFEKGEILEYENGVYKNKYSWVERPMDYPDCFEELEELKEPLFVTEDGVELFEGDEYYPVALTTQIDKRENMSFEAYTITSYLAKLKSEYNLSHNTFKFFSTIKAAEKWIDENKPVFSKKQILDILGRNFIGNISVQYLKEKLGLNNP